MTKKIIIIIVEGMSDEVVLAAGLSEFLADEDYYIKVFYGNLLTSDIRHRKSSKALIGDFIKKEIVSKRHLKREDIAYVMQIADVDNVFRLSELNDFQILHRQRLHELSHTHQIMNIPYQLYFMSSNLEDVLVGRNNCTDEEKEAISIQFASTYQGNYTEFKRFFQTKIIDRFISYKHSWEYLKDIQNDCKGITNLVYMLEQLELFYES